MEKELLKIAAAYIRVSDERQDEYSPDSQLKIARQHAEREGYMIPDEYVFYDDGISGRSTKKRNAFNQMISMAKDKDHPFDVIYVWKFSRFARNQEQSIVYKNLLAKYGVAVASVSEPIPEGPFGTLIERIIEWMDEFYSINLSTEVRRGMTEKASRGEPNCPPPYGYVMKDKKYFPDESGPADIVREVFQRYANGEREREIAVLLGERGVRTKFGNTPDNRWINYMLRNPCYIGKIRWSLDGTRAVSKRREDDESVMVVDGHHEPLISMELWETVQKLIEEQKKAYPAYARREQPIEYMLKGLVRCSSCGATLANGGTSGKAKNRVLQCCNYSRGSCHTSHAVVLATLEEAFVQGLIQAVKNKQFVISPQKPQKKDSSVNYDALIALEERRLVRAKEAYLAEIDSIEQYAKNKKEITERIDDLKARRDSAPAQYFDASVFAKKAAGIVEFIQREDVTATAKNEALRTIIEKIVFDRANGNLAIYFHDIDHN